MGKDIIKMLIILCCVLAVLGGIGYMLLKQARVVVQDVTESAEKAAKGQAVKEGLEEMTDVVQGMIRK